MFSFFVHSHHSLSWGAQLLSKAVVLVFANKQDVKGAMTAAEISEAFALHAIKDREWHIQGACGLTGQGLFEGLDWISSKFTSPSQPR
jgi:ADP-ribosylation factor-like protein 5B